MDVTGDGDKDIVITSRYDKTAYKYENRGNGTYATPIELFSFSVPFPRFVDFADIDGDGDGYKDILYLDNVQKDIVWRRNKNNDDYDPARLLISHSTSLSPFIIMDADSDNDLDIFFSNLSTSNAFWYRNDGNGSFEKSRIKFSDDTGIGSICMTDMNDDNNLDIVGSSGNQLFWLENTGSLEFSEKYSILRSPLQYPTTLDIVDIDNDSDLDVITNSRTDSIVVIYMNDAENFSRYKEIKYGASKIISTDYDNDNDIDLIIISKAGNEVVLVLNDGNENFNIKSILKNTEGIEFIATDDLNNDDFKDIIVVVNSKDLVFWYENDKSGGFLPKEVIINSANGINCVSIYDLDGDNDKDIVSSSQWDDKIAWYENLGEGNFSAQKIISENADYAEFVYVAELSGDTLPDVLSASRYDRKIAWYENLGNKEFSNEKIISEEAKSAYFVKAVDFDNDGDNDIITTIDYGETVWYENDGIGNLGEPINIISEPSYPEDLRLIDLNQDNYLDIAFVFSSKDRIAWSENIINEPSIQGTIFWDRNENGLFDSTETTIDYFSANVSPEETSSYTDSEGTFKFYVYDGNYTLTVQPDSCYQLTTASLSYTVTIDGNVALNKNFGFQLASEYQHPQTRINSTATRCGFEVPFWLSIQNDGCVPSKGQYGLVLDNLVTLIDAAIEPSEIRGDTLLWNYEELFSTQSENINFTLQIAGTEFLGDFIHLTGLSYIENATGELELSSTYDYTSEIRCAYDPNDKLVYPNRLGDYDKNYTLFEEELEYTVRFQNTGTDTAFTVVIKDYLDPNLNWKTFKPVVASHPHETLLHPDGLVEFTFKNILLPDSTTNEPLSHGFVTYKIAPNEGLEENSVIENTANIFFDFNLPIETNTTSNILVEELPKTTATRRITKADFPIKIYPNPFEEIIIFELEQFQPAWLEIFDARGKMVRTSLLQNRIHQEVVSNLPSGLYFYRLSANANRELLTSGRMVKQ